MRWWECGMIGGIVLSGATVANAISAILGGVRDVIWTDVFGVALTVFFMGFLCGVVAWSGKGLHQRLGAIGDALVGAAVMVAFFTCCILLFSPELLGAKFVDTGLLVLGIAVLMGAIGGVWFGHDLDNEASPPGT
ncbi:CHASE2 domain-containing sensor protein [Pseudoxanthomonas japonensis]|uniref:hypothetical protein n=1 Tax=Pseudoxanthomonas japonensis TaxID=69284 RepID=UPI00285FE67F|nr:hypothetical protein [Pseudoxanthomonas japonensis]MDR7070962.1 CHASE2 domain-containing sensor protein [Pseudoxanthomonas japonensis]